MDHGSLPQANQHSLIPLILLQTVAQYDTPLVDKNTTPRMPWHDVSIGVVSLYVLFQNIIHVRFQTFIPIPFARLVQLPVT
jgi:hypothetical protein